jgi:hypothetical protein
MLIAKTLRHNLQNFSDKGIKMECITSMNHVEYARKGVKFILRYVVDTSDSEAGLECCNYISQRIKGLVKCAYRDEYLVHILYSYIFFIL